MSIDTLLNISNYKIGDEIWWFRGIVKNFSLVYDFCFHPGQIELVHDVIKEIKNGSLHCFFVDKKPHEVWGKTRKEAWKSLKKDLEIWGLLDDLPK